MTWVPGLPLDRASSTRGAHPKDSTVGFQHFVDSVDADAIGFDAAEVRAVWDDAVAAPAWKGPPVWVHGVRSLSLRTTSKLNRRSFGSDESAFHRFAPLDPEYLIASSDRSQDYTTGEVSLIDGRSAAAK